MESEQCANEFSTLYHHIEADYSVPTRPLPLCFPRCLFLCVRLFLSKLTISVEAGSNVILLARRIEALKAVSDACVAAHKESGIRQGGKFAAVQIDVSQKDQVAALWDKVSHLRAALEKGR